MLRSLTFASAFLVATTSVQAGPYAPAAGQSGSTAISKDSPLFVGWATGVSELNRGPLDVASPGAGLASAGFAANAFGPADGSSIVSLGDGGWITLTFEYRIRNGAGADFAVFENAFADIFLELAHVEVSSNGVDFFRFPSVSLTPTDSQVGGFGSLDPTNIHNLAGKYRGGFGTPFDLEDLAGASPLLDINNVGFVRILDVVGSVDPSFGSYDSLGNLINDPYSTPFPSGGFDLDAVGVIHAVPETSSLVMLGLAGLGIAVWQRKQEKSSKEGLTSKKCSQA